MKISVFIFLFLCVITSLNSQNIMADLQKVLPNDVVVTLLQEGKMQNSVYRKNGFLPSLTPKLPLAKETLSFWLGEMPPFFTEILYVYPKKEKIHTERDIEKISKILRSLSKLEGIEYFSTSRNKMRTLYEKSYVVNNALEKKRIDDPLVGSADGLIITVLQKDLTFGEYLYSYSFRQNDSSVAFYSANIEPLKYSFFPLISSDKLRISLVIHEFDTHILFYGLTRASFPALPGLESKINASFSTRAEAVLQWFITEYEKY